MDKSDRLRAALRAALAASFGKEIVSKRFSDEHQAFLSLSASPEFAAAVDTCVCQKDFDAAAAKLVADYQTIMSNFNDACLTIEELYHRFSMKIRSTVRNYPKISEVEVDDVEQIIYAQAIEKRWLTQYTGKTKFTTFIYTYVRQAIQNYINIRDSAGRVSSSGTRRYYSLSELLPTDVPEDSFIDFINQRFGASNEENRLCDALLDSQGFMEKCRTHFVSTLLGDISVYDIVCGLMGADNAKPESKERDTWPGEKEVVAQYGISPEWLQRVVELLHVFYTCGVDAAEIYLDRSFFK